MSSDMYPSLSGAKAAWAQMEVLANNLANVSTDAFKEQRITFKSERVSPGALGNSYVRADDVYYDMTQGAVKSTGVETHLALRGPGFFSVQGETEELLQRAGDVLGAAQSGKKLVCRSGR